MQDNEVFGRLWAWKHELQIIREQARLSRRVGSARIGPSQFRRLCLYCLDDPMEGNSTLGKLVMARRDSLQDFETTPRPLLFAPPLHFPPKETIILSQSCKQSSKTDLSFHKLSLRRSRLPSTNMAGNPQLLTEEPEQSQRII